MFDGFKPKPIERPAPGRVQGEKPKRGMFDGLKLDATPATPSPARADRGEDRAFARAVERTSRSAEVVLQARASGAPILEHQKVALERAIHALDTLRPGASDDRSEEHQSELQSLMRNTSAVFCLKKKKTKKT